jgi:hypothetical protein
MSNQAYLQGVAEALSHMNIDPQIKVASYNELEKVAFSVPGAGAIRRLREGAKDLVHKGGKKALGDDVAKARHEFLASRIESGSGARLDAVEKAIADRGILGRLGTAMEDRAGLIGDSTLALGGAGLLGAAGLGVNAALDDSDEVAAAELAAAELAAAEQAESERRRNLALALGGTALAGGLGYGAYKALS